jgi:hypothetical protein
MRNNKDYRGRLVHDKEIDWIIWIREGDPFPETLLKANSNLVIIVKYLR